VSLAMTMPCQPTRQGDPKMAVYDLRNVAKVSRPREQA